MITTLELRQRYIQVHNLNYSAMDEFEKFGQLKAEDYSDELRSLPLDEFMVAAGFVAAEEKLTPSEIICYPTCSQPAKRAYNRKSK